MERTALARPEAVKAFASPGAFATYLRWVPLAIPSDLRRAAVLRALAARIAARAKP